MTRSIFTYVPAVAALFAYVQPAHAGWLDNLLTFRNDQRAEIAPASQGVPPKMVYQPYYGPSEHVAWSNFYTRADLEPQDYLTSSASKVMRPRPQEQFASTPAQAQGGWNAIAEQAMQNAQEERPSNIAIGEPGEGVGMQAGSAQIGRETRIGAPVNDWREASNGATLNSRPGDYDYRLADSRPPLPDEMPAQASNSDTNRADTIDVNLRNDPRYVDFNSAGKVSKYAVQRGDTLSNISSQPAIYNTWKLWPLIYSANRKAIGKDPDNLHYQQRLDIPRDYTSKQEREAERKALGRRPGVYGDGR